MRKIHQNVPVLFDPYPWQVVETSFTEEKNKVNETIFALGNGYLGIRGTFEEGFYGNPDASDPATLINGIYEYYDYHHIWCRPGFPEKYHRIITQPDAYNVRITVDGELVKLDAAKVSNYKRTLDMQNGLLTREFRYAAASGAVVDLVFRRFVSLTEKHTTAMQITVQADRACAIVVSSILDAEIKKININDGEKCVVMDNCFNRLNLQAADRVGSVVNETKRSKFTIAAAFTDRLDDQVPAVKEDETSITNEYAFQAKAGKAYTFERITCYATNRDFPVDELEASLRALTAAQAKIGYAALFQAHSDAWHLFWDQTGVEIKGDDLILQGLRFAMYHLNQSAGRDGITNISANGLTGVGYSGHTFWDTEIFMLPMFLYTQPEVAKQLLIYRYNILDKAKERARQMDDVGALFSWNSINGEECGHVFEAVTAQYHIDTDIYYAIHHYMQATNDEEFLVNYGAEILFEMTKCLAHRGNFIPLKNNQFCINVICGPDEYSPIVDNNCYTNWLCRNQFYYTLDTVALLREKYPEKFQALLAKCEIDEEEIALWQRAADNMYIPYHEGLDIYMQDDQFLYRDPIDIENIPVERLPLLTHLHPLNLWRYQVAKQADIVLLMYLCSEGFTPEMRKKIFDFYEPKTIHDSSLSAGVHSIVACDIGYADEAYGYFKQTTRMDLDNVNRNTALGVHSACMGNSWQILTGGLGGMRMYDNALHFRPICPGQWEEYKFHLQYHQAKINVCVTPKTVTYTLLAGDSASFYHKDEPITLSKEKAQVTFPLD